VASADAAAPLIVLASGDGGWAEIDQELAERWQARGWPVVGFNSLKYFWQKRTPEEFTADLERLLGDYRLKWGDRSVVVVGFSFGAVVVPFAGNRFSAAARDRMGAMILISPTEFSIWEVKLSGWFGGGTSGPPVAPELAKLAPLPVLVLTGEHDPDAFHEWAERAEFRHEMWPGDHHLDKRYDEIDQTVAVFLQDAGIIR